MGKKILIVDDEKNIVEILRYNLKKEGFEVLEAYDGEKAVEIALNHNPDLILLDIMLPVMDGYAVCLKLRETLSTPIIMITAKEEEIDKVLGLELGADDYITKPFSFREVLARVKTNLRRITEDSFINNSENVLKCSDLLIDLDNNIIQREGKCIGTTLKEFKLLKFLAFNRGVVFTREQLIELIATSENNCDVRLVDMAISRLKIKIEQDFRNPRYIMTKRGVGYYFNSSKTEKK